MNHLLTLADAVATHARLTPAKLAVRDFVKRLNRDRGVTVILTTHDLGDVEQLCRRVVLIDHGRVIADDTPIGALGLSTCLTAGIIWQGARGSIVPWVVQVDKLGEAREVAAGLVDAKRVRAGVVGGVLASNLGIAHTRHRCADACVVHQQEHGCHVRR